MADHLHDVESKPDSPEDGCGVEFAVSSILSDEDVVAIMPCKGPHMCSETSRVCREDSVMNFEDPGPYADNSRAQETPACGDTEIDLESNSVHALSESSTGSSNQLIGSDPEPVKYKESKEEKHIDENDRTRAAMKVGIVLLIREVERALEDPPIPDAPIEGPIKRRIYNIGYPTWMILSAAAIMIALMGAVINELIRIT